MNKNMNDEYDEPIDFLGYFIKYISHWKWILLSISVCIVIALVYLKFTLPTYEVTTSILLKDDQKGGGTAELNAFKEMGLFTQKNNVDNELEVLRTSALAQTAVNELGIYVNYTQLAQFEFLNQIGIDSKIAIYRKKVIYGSETPLLISLPKDVKENMTNAINFEVLVHPYGEYIITGSYQGEKYSVKSSISDKEVSLPFGKIYLTRGKFRPTQDMLIDVVIQNPLSMAQDLLGQMKMELTSKSTSVVNIALQTNNILLGKDFLNKLVEVYNRTDMDDQAAMAAKTASFIDDRLMTLTRELGDVESQVENYKRAQGITDIKSQSDMFIQQTGDFTQKRLEVETQLAIVTAIDEYMQKKENRYQLLPTTTVTKSDGLNELITNYNRLVLERNRLSQIASSSNQAMINVTNQIESMFNTVQTSVRNEKNNLQIAQRDLLAKNNENKALIRDIPRQDKEYTEIKRQQGVKEALFLFLLQKKEEKYLNGAVVEPIAKMIDNVQSTGAPVSPKKMFILLISVVFGMVLPVFGIKIRDLLRYQIETKEELEEFSNVPILGEIPKNELKDNSFIKENNNDSFTEMVRLLRTNLLFVLNTPEKKVINMVSSISGEGKTFVSINLALSLAFLDKKVILVGLDIRKSMLAEYLKMDNSAGITTFLSGQLGQNDLIKPSGLHPNLSVITAGPVPPNPNELLAKPILDKLIVKLREHYDYIVIDTAPVGVVSDSFTLNRLADVNLYLVRAKYTPKKIIQDATNLYMSKKLNEMYFVLNDFDHQKNTYHKGNGKKYGYGYGFGNKNHNTYGYGNESETKKN
jgi:capsular exopolysaccharide synthesis family protein